MSGLMRMLVSLLVRRALPGLIALVPAAWRLLRGLFSNKSDSRSAARDTTSTTAQGPIEQAFARAQSDVVLTQTGRVIKQLPDDTVGDRHQRILVALDSGATVLIAHNIDLARRVANPQRGDVIRFKGEYEYNDKGGVVHWTHHDPKGWHEDGWIEHDGAVYG